MKTIKGIGIKNRNFDKFKKVSVLYYNPLYCFHNLSSSNLNVLDKSHNGNSNKL